VASQEKDSFPATPELRRTFEQALTHVHEPRILVPVAERREPHLPVQARLMRRDESQAAGNYTDSVAFANTTTGNGNTSRAVGLLVQPTLWITNAARLADDFVLSFNTQTGQDYTVEYADSLPPPVWSNLITVPGNGGLIAVTNQNAPPGQRYYRVRTP
jgi:hypothetical protein